MRDSDSNGSDRRVQVSQGGKKMSYSVCPDCGKVLGDDRALSWHQESVHGLDRPKSMASFDPDLEARVDGKRRESGRAVATLTAETGKTAQPEDKAGDMKGELRGWGIALILIGVAQFFIPLLDPLWAFVVVPLGVLSLFIGHRGIFIPIGSALVLIGLLNILGGGFGGWTVYGAAQIFWGVQEFRKFEEYAGVE